MAISFIILALLSSFVGTFANEKQPNDDLKEELGRLKTEFRKLENEVQDLRILKQRFSKVESLESEVKELRWLLKQQKMERSRRAVLLPPVWTSCPNGTVQHGSSCYMVSKEVANWPDSLVYCEAYGGNLAVIETASEQQFIASHIAKVNPTATDPAKYYWIGGLDALRNNEWFWSKSVKPINYFHWGPGEPDSSGTHNSKTQDCLALFAAGWWDDGWCEDQHNFICEIKLNEDNVLVG